MVCFDHAHFLSRLTPDSDLVYIATDFPRFLPPRMALRNYLYAKHDHDTSIDIKINKDNSLMSNITEKVSPSSPSPSDPSDSQKQQRSPMQIQQSRRRIIRIVQKKSSNKLKLNPLVNSIEKLTNNIENVHIEKKKKENCLNDCNLCDCKNETNDNEKDNPLIQVEVDNRVNSGGVGDGGHNEIVSNNEIDFTSSL